MNQCPQNWGTCFVFAKLSVPVLPQMKSLNRNVSELHTQTYTRTYTCTSSHIERLRILLISFQNALNWKRIHMGNEFDRILVIYGSTYGLAHHHHTMSNNCISTEFTAETQHRTFQCRKRAAARLPSPLIT